MQYLSKIIKEKPQETTQKSVESNKYFTEEATDLFYKEKRTVRGWMSWIIGVFFVTLLLVSLIFFPSCIWL